MQRKYPRAERETCDVIFSYGERERKRERAKEENGRDENNSDT